MIVVFLRGAIKRSERKNIAWAYSTVIGNKANIKQFFRKKKTKENIFFAEIF